MQPAAPHFKAGALMQVRWRDARNPRPIIALVADRALTLAYPAHHLGYLLRPQPRPRFHRFGNPLALLLGLLARALGQRNIVAVESQVALGHMDADESAALE